jgi:uncharacterized protein (TIGR02611 family)
MGVRPDAHDPRRAADGAPVNGPNTTVEVGGSVSATPPRWLHPIRRTVHRLPAGPLIWKIGIAAIGAAIVLVGLLLIPLPGPGWALVFLGVGVWATEFGWARRLLVRGREILKASTARAARQPPAVRVLLGVLAVAVLAGLLWLGWHLLL